MGVQVQFDYDSWKARYPEFTVTVPTKERGQPFFDEAGLYLRNDGTGPVPDSATQTMLMNMLTAHIAQLEVGSTWTANTSNPVVGRIVSATEGTVTIQTENKYGEGTVQWFQQTKYGSKFWTATAAYRSMHYRPGRVRHFNQPPLPRGYRS